MVARMRATGAGNRLGARASQATGRRTEVAAFPRGWGAVEVRAHGANLVAVARALNSRPRQALNWIKPCEVVGRVVASAA